MSFEDLPPEIIWNIIQKSNYTCANAILRLNKDYHEMITSDTPQFAKVTNAYFVMADEILEVFFNAVIKMFMDVSPENDKTVNVYMDYQISEKHVILKITQDINEIFTVFIKEVELESFTLTYLQKLGWPASSQSKKIIKYMKRYDTLHQNRCNFSYFIHDTLQTINNLNHLILGRTDSDSKWLTWGWVTVSAAALFVVAVVVNYFA